MRPKRLLKDQSETWFLYEIIWSKGWNGVILTAFTISRCSYSVEDRAKGQRQLNAVDFPPCDMHSNAMPVSVEQPMWIQKASNA